MKKILILSVLMLATLFQGCMVTTTSFSASSSMSTSKVRTHARFLTDRMAYELDLSPRQYDDCYEINYDFIYYVSGIMNDVAHGYYDAINSYYRYLDYRNDDLRYIMTAGQYIRFLSREYFYRPVYTSGNTWNFRVYTIYSNHSFYYYDAPAIFQSYRGGHGRTYYSNGFYSSRYGHDSHFMGNPRIMGSSNFNDSRRNDFGTNLRDRNQKPDYNNYNNRNSNDRTSDPRYRDNSGNQNAPQINSRRTTGSEQRGATQSTRTTQTSRTTTPTATTTPQTTPQQSTTTTSRRGSSSQTTTTGGTRSGTTGTTTRETQTSRTTSR